MSSNDETQDSDEQMGDDQPEENPAQSDNDHQEEEEEEGDEHGEPASEQESSNQEGQEEEENEDDQQRPRGNSDDEQVDDESDNPREEAVDRTNPFDEDSVEAAQNLTQEDVFGEDLSESSGDERAENDNDRSQNENFDEDLPEEQVEVTTPYVKCDLGQEIHLVKLPSFMKIESKPYDAQSLNEEALQDDDEESKARLKIKVENTIRWRFSTNESGEVSRESNTRLVRWSDGSLSLHVGKEIFDVSKSNIQSDHNHLFVRHQRSMQAQALFKTRLAFRQHSNDSLAHLKLKFATQSNPKTKVRVLSNIDAQKITTNEMRKKEEQLWKAEERRKNKLIRDRERSANRGRRVLSSHLEDRSDDDDDANDQDSPRSNKETSKTKMTKSDYRRSETIDEDEDDDDEGLSEKPKERRNVSSSKHRKLTSSDEEEEEQVDLQSKRKRSLSNRSDDQS